MDRFSTSSSAPSNPLASIEATTGTHVFPSTTHFPLPVTQFYYQPSSFEPYDSNLPYMQAFRPNGHPLYSFAIGQSSVPFGMLKSLPQALPSQPAREEENKTRDAWMCKIARRKRKQILQAKRRSRSLTSEAPYILESNQWYIRAEPFTSGDTNTQNISSFDVCTPDGKKLKEILTKKLRKSDVGTLGRIILPKRDAEEKLPPLWSKDAIDIVFQDVYSDQRWNMKYRYWSNNNSRMYVVENAGAFVNHHGLQIGDYVTMYEDEFKNLYLSAKKERNIEASEPSSSFMHAPESDRYQAKDDEEDVV